MSSTLWLCLILLASTTSSHARPRASPGSLEDGPSGTAPEYRVNLHHSLKKVQDAATKMVKDVHGYIHQRFTSLAKKQLDAISRPLIKVVAPVFYIKDRLVSMGGTRKPSNQEDITSWCPTCLETNSFDPCEENDSDCLEASKAPVDDFIDRGSSSPFVSSPTESSVTVENQKALKSEDVVVTSAETRVPSELDLVFPGVWEKQTKLLQNEREFQDQFKNIKDFPDMSIDIRFGNDQGPLLGNLTLMGLNSNEKRKGKEESLLELHLTSDRSTDQIYEHEDLTTECTLCLKGIPLLNHRDEEFYDSKSNESKKEKSSNKPHNNVLKTL